MKKCILIFLFIISVSADECKLNKSECLEKKVEQLSLYIEQIQKENEATKRELNDLKSKIGSKSFSEFEIKTATEHEILKTQIKELSNIAEKSETKMLMDKINFTPEASYRVDLLDYKSNFIEGEDTLDVENGGVQRRDEFKKEFDPHHSFKFKFNMTANLFDDTSFKGRMVVNRSTQSKERMCILSHDIKSSPNKTSFDIDRAYVDYKFDYINDIPMVFSFGILPTSGGTPMQYSDNSSRKSMFPAIVFDMNSFGAILTSNVSNITNTKDSFLRAIIAQSYTLDGDIYAYQCNRETIDNAEVYGLYFESSIPKVGDNLLSIGINHLRNFKAHPYLGPNYTAEGTKILGDITTFGVGLDFNKILDSKIG
ncbi:MAG: DUF3373 family protein, partial [Campylobacterales bacterium]|nr:DUF3373 family protein [Campylobacterales bacterium]